MMAGQRHTLSELSTAPMRWIKDKLEYVLAEELTNDQINYYTSNI